MTHCKQKRMYEAHRRYMQSNAHDIFDVYTKPSQAKEYCFMRCKESSLRLNGDEPCIISYNSFAFSVAFYAKRPETNDIIFVVITPEKELWCYKAEIDELIEKYS